MLARLWNWIFNKEWALVVGAVVAGLAAANEYLITNSEAATSAGVAIAIIAAIITRLNVTANQTVYEIRHDAEIVDDEDL